MILILPAAAGATVAGHAEADLVPSLPQSVMDSVGEQKWLFAHASVGGNMIDGMEALHFESAGRYRLVFATAGDGGQIYPPPNPTVPGTVYDGSRGNPGWAAKVAMFDDAVRDLGWRAPVVGAAMDKLCYIDTDADVAVYLASMTALEADFPATDFIYTTMPLQSGAGANWENVLATTYNQAVRLHCAGAERILLDIADIECHDPDGNHITFLYNGQVYERMWSGYTSDGGHLNALGARRVALGWYYAAAVIAGAGSAVPEASGALTPGIVSIAPNPAHAGAAIGFRLDAPGRAEVVLLDPRGRLVARLLESDLSDGPHSVTWNGRGLEGRRAPAGVYLALLRAGGLESVRRLVVR
jgi:hypothetical protein